MTELIIIILYFAGMLAIGVVSRRKSREADDFFVAGGKVLLYSLPVHY